MEANRFDALAKVLGGRRSRRSALKGGGAGLAAVVALRAPGAAGLRHAAAQDSTPAADEALAEGEVLTDDAFLFVQTAMSGSFVPNPDAGNPGADGTPTPGGGADYLLTLEGHTGGTVYFSDRPARIFGESPTEDFLAGLGFAPDNPPNAALVAQTDAGDDVVVLELVTPAFDAGTGTLTYGANILTEYDGTNLAHAAALQEDDELPEAFGRASLFIDDCPDIVNCYSGIIPYSVGPLPGGPIGTCYSWSKATCLPCNGQSLDYYSRICVETYPDTCTEYCGVKVA